MYIFLKEIYSKKKSIASIILLAVFGLQATVKELETKKKKILPLVTLGKYLFYDTRLSLNNTKSCGSCHDPKFAFTDNYRTSIGATGENVKRNAPSLINVANATFFTWADTTITSLAKQMLHPLYNNSPVEIGLNNNEQQVLHQLAADNLYQQLFHQSFPTEKNAFTISNIIKSIVAFEKSLVSYNSPYDWYVKGNKKALTNNQKEGKNLFFSTQLHCNTCHSGNNFTTEKSDQYFRVMIDSLDNDEGLYTITKNKADKGKFKAPTLRNLIFTSPYWHDGSKTTLFEVIEAHSYTKQISLPKKEKEKIVAFLASLTDSSILSKKEWSNPYNLSN